MGFTARPMPGKQRTTVGLVGNDGSVDGSRLEARAGRTGSHPRLEAPTSRSPASGAPNRPLCGFQVASRSVAKTWWSWPVPARWRASSKILTAAVQVRDAGATILRAGAFKPRSSPYSFQGLGAEGLKLLARAREETGLLIVTEAMDAEGADLVAEVADIIQIGARNMQNYSLLKKVGRLKRPVLLKRGLSATIQELLLSAEYILAEGNPNVILCERGVRGFDSATRNLFDLSAIPVVKALSHLPIIADPSHGTGHREMVTPMARAAVAAGADGLLIEVHPNPDRALSDGAQSLYPEQFARLMKETRMIAEAIGRKIAAPRGSRA